MRIYVLSVLAIAAGMNSSQQVAKQAAARYEPPGVIAPADVIYPLQSVASGTVVLEVALNDAGEISNVRVVRGIASLTEPAEHSVRQWKFQTAKIDGKPVPSKIPVAFSFVPPNVGPRL
jgi:TonB family protein